MIYFDNSATTIMRPPEVAEAVAYAVNNFGNAGRSFYDPVLTANREIFNARAEIAKLMEYVAFGSVYPIRKTEFFIVAQ